MSEQQYQKRETKVYALTEDELKELDEKSLEFIKQEYVQGGHSSWIPHPQYKNTETTNLPTITKTAMDFFNILSEQQANGYTHVGVGEKKYKISGNDVYRSTWYKEGEKKAWKPWPKKEEWLEEIFVATDFEVVNNKIASNKEHNWKLITTLLNQSSNAATFVIARIKTAT